MLAPESIGSLHRRISLINTGRKDMTAQEIKKCTDVSELRNRVKLIERIVITSDKPELRLRNEAVRICQRLAELGC